MSGEDELCRCGCDDFKAYGYTSYCNNCGHRHTGRNTGLVASRLNETVKQDYETKTNEYGKLIY